MRVLVLVAFLTPAAAHADGILEGGGALTFPIADNNWTNTVDTSPELGVRFGALALPIGHHAKKAMQAGEISFDYERTSGGQLSIM